MAGSRFASRRTAGLVIAFSEGAPSAWRVTLFASPVIIAVVPLTELGRTRTLGELASLLIVGSVGWGAAFVGFLCLRALLHLGRGRQLALDQPWRRVALLLSFGVVAGLCRAAVLREGGAMIGFQDPIEANARMIVAAQVGASWALVAALIAFVILRYRSIRVAQIAELTLTMKLSTAAEAEANREVQFIVARARDDALAAASDLDALGSNASATHHDIAAALANAASRVRAISHSLEQAPMPAASEVRIRFREIAITTARSVPPSVGAMVGGIALVVVLTIAWTTARVGVVPTIRSAAFLLLGSAAATLAAQRVWHHRPRARVLTTFTLLTTLGSLLPGDLLLAGALGDPASAGEWLTRLVLAPMTAVSLLALLAIGGSPRLARSDWERSVGPRRIEALHRAQLASGARQRIGRILHSGALSRLHAAALTAGREDPRVTTMGHGSSSRWLSQAVTEFAEALPTAEDAGHAHAPRDWIPAVWACEDARARWAGFASVDARVEPSLEEANVPRFVREIVSEAVTNAVRHGGARHVSIDFTREGSALRVTIIDDGSGPISPEGHRPAGQGSRDLDRLAPRSWHRAMHPSGGTELSVTIPLAIETAPSLGGSNVHS